MGLLDKLGQATLGAVARVARKVDDVRERRAAVAAAGDEIASPEAAPVADSEAVAKAPAPKPALAEEIGDETIRAQVFGRMSCPWTQRALRLMEDRGIEHVYTALDEPGGYALAPRLASTTGQRTVPYVYLRGTFIGGYDALDEIDRLGQLDEMVKSAEERAASPKNRIRIQVAPRK